MFTESGVLPAVGRVRRSKEQTGAGEKRHQHSPPADDDEAHGWEPLRVYHSREENRSEAVQRAEDLHFAHHQHAAGDVMFGAVSAGRRGEERRRQHQQQQPHAKEEHKGGWVRPATLLQSASKTVPDRRTCSSAGPAARLARDEEARRRRVVGSHRWAALQVSIPRLEVNGSTAKVVADGGGSSTSSSTSGNTSVSVTAAALSGVSSRVHGWQGTAGVQASAAPPGIGERGVAALLGQPPSDGEVGGVAPGNGATTLVSAAKVAASSGAARAEGGGVVLPSLFLTESRPLSLPAVRGIPEGTLDQPQPQPQPPPTPSSTYMSPVESYVTKEGVAANRFCKSAPTRRGKWSRMEEEYAKRIISDFDEGLLDAPAGVSLRQLLSSKLHCEVMRVSKKFCGWQCVGKRCFRPVFHQDGRTTRARASLLEMEQNWLKTFPSPSRAKPARKLSIGGDGSGDTTTPVDGGSERPAPLSPAGGVSSRANGATPAQSRLSRAERGLAGDTSTGARESPAKERRPHCGRAIWETSGEEPRDAPSRGEQGQEVERNRYGGRALASPIADEGDQQQLRAVAGSGGYNHRRHHSVEIGSGSNIDPNGYDGVNRRSWTPSSSHGSHYMQGGTPPRKHVASQREEHGDIIRSSPDSLSLLQRAQADRLLSGSAIGCDRDADPYPVFLKRREGGRDSAAAIQRVANESAAAAGGGGEVSRTSGSGLALAQEARPHRRQSRFPCTNTRREAGHARENTHERRREGIRTTVSGAPAGGVRLARREHDAGRHVSAADETYPDPFPHYQSERQRAASGSHNPRHGGNGGRAGRSHGGWGPAEAAVGRSPFRPVKPEPAALLLHFGVDNYTKTFHAGSEQAPEPGRCLPQASYRVGPPPEPSSNQRHTSRQFSLGQDHYYHSAKEEVRAWEDSLTAWLGEHRPAKTPRVIGSFCHAGAGRSGGRSGGPLYPRYRKHQHQREHRPQQQRRHPGTATASYWQSGRTGDNGHACAAMKAYSSVSLSDPMGGDATPPQGPPSRDCFLRVSASSISTVVPSNKYGPVVVGQRELVQPFWAF